MTSNALLVNVFGTYSITWRGCFLLQTCKTNKTTINNKTVCCHFWAPIWEHEKDNKLGSSSSFTPKKNTTNSCVVHCHLWVSSLDHENNEEQLFVVIFRRLLQIMKTMMNNYSLMSLGTCPTSWRWWRKVVHCHLWALALDHEDDNKQLLVIVFGCMFPIMKMTTSNYSLSSLDTCFASWRPSTSNYSLLSLGACSASWRWWRVAIPHHLWVNLVHHPPLHLQKPYDDDK